MEELKPCPFCGKKPKLYNFQLSKAYIVSCVNDNCKIRPETVVYQRKPYAIKAWNKRSC